MSTLVVRKFYSTRVGTAKLRLFIKVKYTPVKEYV